MEKVFDAPFAGARPSAITGDYEEYWVNLSESAKYFPSNRYRYSLIRGLLAPVFKPGMRLVDMGCGDSALLNHLRAAWPDRKYFGSDISEEIIGRNRAAQKDVTYFQSDISKPEFIEKAKAAGLDHCDVIVSSEVIEHVESDQGLLDNASRLLKSGGHLIITAPTGPRNRMDIELFHHHRHYVREELGAMIAAKGFEVLESIRCGWPVISFQRWMANKMFNTVIQQTASSKRPTLLIRSIMSAMYYAARVSPRRGGPMLIFFARKR